MIIADKLREMADILELQHDDGFRVAAYHRAARTLMALTCPVDEIVLSEGLAGLMKLANSKSPERYSDGRLGSPQPGSKASAAEVLQGSGFCHLR